MSYRITKFSNQRWGIFHESRLLATIATRQEAQSIVKILNRRTTDSEAAAESIIQPIAGEELENSKLAHPGSDRDPSSPSPKITGKKKLAPRKKKKTTSMSNSMSKQVA